MLKEREVGVTKWERESAFAPVARGVEKNKKFKRFLELILTFFLCSRTKGDIVFAPRTRTRFFV